MELITDAFLFRFHSKPNAPKNQKVIRVFISLFQSTDIIDVIILLYHIVCCLCSSKPNVKYLSFSDFLQNAIDEAIEMYQELHMWDDCIAVAEVKVIRN